VEVWNTHVLIATLALIMSLYVRRTSRLLGRSLIRINLIYFHSLKISSKPKMREVDAGAVHGEDSMSPYDLHLG
jgi:hypothetical protein